MPGPNSYGPAGKWVHDRAHGIMDKRKSDLIERYGEKKGKSIAYALAVQQGHKVKKTPKDFRTAQGVREAKAKLDKPVKEYQKVAALRKAAEDLIPGGKAQGHPSSDYPADQIRMGVKVEREHTPDPRKAEEIARDHLQEFPRYYSALKKMESQLEKKGDGDEANEGKETDVTPGKKVPREALLQFFRANPNPDDEKVHELAEAYGTDPHTMETQIYGILSDLMQKRAGVAAVLARKATPSFSGAKRLSPMLGLKGSDVAARVSTPQNFQQARKLRGTADPFVHQPVQRARAGAIEKASSVKLAMFAGCLDELARIEKAAGIFGSLAAKMGKTVAPSMKAMAPQKGIGQIAAESVGQHRALRAAMPRLKARVQSQYGSARMAA